MKESNTEMKWGKRARQYNNVASIGPHINCRPQGNKLVPTHIDFGTAMWSCTTLPSTLFSVYYCNECWVPS